MKLNLEKKFAPMLRRLGYRIIDWKPAKVQANRDRRVKWVNRFFDKQWKIKNFVDTTVVGGLAKFNSVFKTKHLPSFPAGENPFNHDSYSMGEYFGSEKHICIMYDHSGEYFNIVHIPSGQRLQISLPKYQKEKDVVYVLNCRMSSDPLDYGDLNLDPDARIKEDKFTVRVQITGPNSWKFLDGYNVLGKAEGSVDPKFLANVGPVYESFEVMLHVCDMLGEHYGHADYGFAVDSYYKE
jgi:hypothetical protein